MRRFAVLVVVVALAPFVVRYPTLETQILTFGLLAVAFNVLLGEMGFLSFGQATFNGVGAYAAARVLIDLHAPLLLALGAGIAAGALVAAAIGALAITGRGVYGVMLTFAFNEMAYYLAFQWRDVTGGDNGLRGIPRPDVFGISLDDATRYYLFTATVVLVAFAFVLRLIDSPFGAVLRAIRENEDRARAIGFRVRRFKIVAFAISGGLSGLAGALYAGLFRFVPLQSIDLDTSTNIVVATLLGGTGSPYGPLLGAAVFTILSNSLSHVWSHWPLLFGVVFCIVVLFFRGGLWSISGLWNRRATHA
ncbi:MAG: transporter permease [Candidatus Eremiobacteraeota bacterium]|nr:transporter permease [Candidatus Eremiobacteraeota bacterium]